ncbi:pseudouridine synthase [Paraliomyxa miuraensis]|uniref:pseudouridine synthase n=1 Tax=Paraliomyxa miuraensis TaxID=376150 RepID=UPI00225257E6|nr:pseudouridine synthase [Paraliomyxa miuraensis]MCX4241436.1 pseudouridine synthase [Paraliomyxa miuraensis]
MPRLDALIARNLGLSRRQVTRLLRAGRIHDPGGLRLDDGRIPCLPSEGPRQVVVDGEPHTLHHRVSLRLHKPVGVVTAHDDPRHPTAHALLREAPLFRELRAVGRLDLDTSGLLLWTTDGTLLHRLTHPRYGVPREYHVGLAGGFRDPPSDLRLDDGHAPRIVALERRVVTSMHPGLRRSPDARVHATITLTTGRFHEVRRIFMALGTEVLDLCRVRFGVVELPVSLPASAHEPIDLHAVFRGLSPQPEA